MIIYLLQTPDVEKLEQKVGSGQVEELIVQVTRMCVS